MMHVASQYGLCSILQYLVDHPEEQADPFVPGLTESQHQYLSTRRTAMAKHQYHWLPNLATQP